MPLADIGQATQPFVPVHQAIQKSGLFAIGIVKNC